jgi:hypothetical protein
VSAALAGDGGGGRRRIAVQARVTLFIGNDNAKGQAAIASLLRQLGRHRGAAGTLRAGGGCACSAASALGPHTACDFDGPRHDLLPELLGVTRVEVKVGFELPLLTRACRCSASGGCRRRPDGPLALAPRQHRAASAARPAP